MMKLEQLEIENFKCFKSKKTFDFGRITVLTGANNSGKSTVMQAIWSILQSDSFPHRLSLNGNTVTLGDFEQVVNQKDITKKVEFSLKFSEKYEKFSRNKIFKTSWKIDSLSSQAELDTLDIESSVTDSAEDKQFRITKNEKGNFDIELYGDFSLFGSLWSDKLDYDGGQLSSEIPFIYEENLIKDIDFESLEKLVKKIEREYLHRPERGGEGVREVYRLMRDCFSSIKTFRDGSNYITPDRLQLKESYFDKNQIDYKIAPNGEGFLDLIAEWQKKSKGKIESLLKELKNLDLITDVTVNRTEGGKFEVLVKTHNSDSYRHLTSVGLGVSQFMPIIVADLQLDDDSTLCIAEPEANLHPSIQAKFGDYLINQIKNTKKNYIIETHSEYLLNRLRLAIVKEEKELKEEDLKVYFLENDGEDTKVSNVKFTKTGEIKDAPQGFFETYLMDTMEIALNAFAE
jgi:predicted ATPase